MVDLHDLAVPAGLARVCLRSCSQCMSTHSQLVPWVLCCFVSFLYLCLCDDRFCVITSVRSCLLSVGVDETRQDTTYSKQPIQASHPNSSFSNPSRLIFLTSHPCSAISAIRSLPRIRVFSRPPFMVPCSLPPVLLPSKFLVRLHAHMLTLTLVTSLQLPTPNRAQRFKSQPPLATT
ncbi:hypothetical protein K474DRAFT_1386142 [Panus rudis PR-1116 ss-1]|nr:hypothetical protein K474DRAFT_1386142 [Panus rudis PR-1116 ss-1]